MSEDFTSRMLDLAARAALRGFGLVEPNPMVGCVLVRDGRVVGIGHHRRFGGPHAEREAIADAVAAGYDARGATAYVTLEPCDAPGKQPPCTRALIEAGVARVVYARPDPSPGKGGWAAGLRSAGVECEESGASALARGVGLPFVKRVTTGLPWVIAKWAQTIDGRVATRTGESKWISGERARLRVHRLRGRVDAILTGIGTAVVDNPLLTARGVRVRRVARRVIADSDLDLPTDGQLAATAREVPVIAACDEEVARAEIFAPRRAALEGKGVRIVGVPSADPARGIDLGALLALLGREGVATLLVEAGPGLLGSLLDQDLVDEAVVYVAPLLLGDDLAKAAAVGRVAESLAAGRRYDLWRAKALDGDVELTYRRKE